MLRMAHRIATANMQSVDLMAGCYDRDCIEHSKLMFKDFQEGVSRSTCFYIQNIADFYYEHPQAIWHVDKDFPGCAAFLPSLFFEWTEPSRILIDGQWQKVEKPVQISCLMVSETVNEVRLKLPSDLQIPDKLADNRITKLTFALSRTGRVEFVCSFVSYFSQKDWTPIVPILSAHVGGPRCSKEYQEFGAVTLMGTFLHIPLLALSFANCKNVTKTDATADLAPTVKWIRQQKAPEIRYHVLNINPMKEVLRTEGGLDTNGLKRAMHICRGSFATYTEEKPLFGKLVGKFWRPATVRGKAENGVVVKDYSVGNSEHPVASSVH